MEILKSLFDDFAEVFTKNPAQAFDTPLNVVEAMWQVKWGNKWVPVGEFEKDSFWREALLRLTANDMLESHRIITAPNGNSGLVYRLKSHD
jgi:hypothetical protein